MSDKVRFGSGAVRAAIEALEPRRLMSTILVTTLADSGAGSLRAAITQANADNASDTIQFQSGLGGDIQLSTVGDTTFGPSALGVTGAVVIQGPQAGQGITISLASGAATMRLFAVESAGNLTLQNLTLSGGIAEGGAGGSGGRGGGGGGAGLGGAIFNDGTLTVEDSTFVSNQAIGGAGGSGGIANLDFGGSGGGGLGGDGSSGSTAGPGGAGGGPSGGAGGSADAAGGDGGFGGGGGGGPAQSINTQTQIAGNGGFGGGGGARGFGSGPGGDGGFGGGGGYGDSAGAGGFGGGNEDTDSFGGGGGAGLGGAIFNDGGEVELSDSTFTANTAAGGAGGGNAQAGSGFGGAIFNYNGNLSVLNCTIASNAASNGNGIFNLGDGESSTAILINTIISPATNALVYFDQSIDGGTAVSAGDGDIIASSNGFGGTVVSNADPQLGPLADNGGPTETMLPAESSPAIAAGDAAAAAGESSDQRGYPRVVDSTVDIGAVETGTLPPSFTSNLPGTLTAGQSATLTFTATGTPTPAFSESGALPQGMSFVDNGNGTATLSGTPSPGVYPLTIQAANGSASPATQNFTLDVVADLPATVAVGEFNGEGVINVLNSSGAVQLSITPFASMPNVTPVVAMADLDNNGVPDIIAAEGLGGKPRVKVYNGATGQLLDTFLAFSLGYNGGLSLAVGDVTGDGTPDIVVGKAAGGVSRVRVFDGVSLALVSSFLAYDPSFMGGVRVAVADFSGNGFDDIVTAPGPGAAEPVEIFSGQSVINGGSQILSSFYPFGSTFSDGINIAAGGIGGSPDVIAAEDAGGTPEVAVFNGMTGDLLDSFMAFSSGFTGGVRVGLGFTDDGETDILAAAGAGNSQVEIFSAGGTLLTSFKAGRANAPGGRYAA